MTDNGLDSAEVLKYAKYLNAQGLIDFDTLLLNCGLHDIKTTKKGGSTKRLYRNLEETLKIFEAHSVKIHWVTTTPVNDGAQLRHGSAFRCCNSDVLEHNAAARQIISPLHTRNRPPSLPISTPNLQTTSTSRKKWLLHKLHRPPRLT